MLRGWLAALVLVLLSVSSVPGSTANHPQAAHGDVIVFDHRTGNEWWVEVQLSGGASGSVAGVQAMDDGGPWVGMAYHPEWAPGDWAASFHIEPGHRVMFRALWSGGDMVDSCWFTHPQGVEQCSAPPPPPPDFHADFSSVKGNEWWVEAKVAANRPLAGVDARVDCIEPWHALTLRSWGAWAASFHVPPGGHHVDFRARSTDGAIFESPDGYVWPQATSTSGCAGGPPPPPPPPTAVFYDNVKGNEWWIQASAHSKSPIAGVDARVNGGTWVAMGLHDYGWAVSTHAPPGSHVQFRARFPDGTYAFVPNGWAWTSATQYPAQSPSFSAAFENTDHGNPGWVQVNVYAPANWGLGAVKARVDGGAWQDLHQQPWGDWAAPIHADNGSAVQFMAVSGGSTPASATSGQFVWPSGRAISAWPVEGSFATYSLLDGFGSPGGGYAIETRATVRLQYHAGQWSGTCVGRTQEMDQPQSGGPYVVYHDFNWTSSMHEGPPTAPTSPILDATTNLHPLHAGADPQSETGSCGHTEVITMPMGKTRYLTQLKDRDGHALVLPVWEAHHDPADYTPVADDDDWEPRLGLMTDWFHSAQDKGGWSGHLTDTDAPIR